MKERDKVKKRYRTNINYDFFKNLRNQVQILIRDTKKNYYQNEKLKCKL